MRDLPSSENALARRERSASWVVQRTLGQRRCVHVHTVAGLSLPSTRRGAMRSRRVMDRPFLRLEKEQGRMAIQNTKIKKCYE